MSTATSDNGELSAAILAGGIGSRLKSALPDLPKVLAPVQGRPFLAYLLDQLEAAQVRRVVLCTGYRGEQVHQVFGARYGNLDLVYSQETQPLGTAGALRLALPWLKRDLVLVMNGDSYCATDLRAYWSWHRARRIENSLIAVRVEETERFGCLLIDNQGLILAFNEKPNSPSSGTLLEGSRTTRLSRSSGWINAGVYLLSKERIRSIPSGKAVSLELQLFPTWVAHGLYAYPISAPFLDIGTKESYGEAEQFFASHSLAAATRRAFRERFPRLVLVDRDGTINVEKHYLSDPDRVELLPNAARGLRRMRQLGLKMVIVTNQSAIGRRRFGQDTLERIHSRLLEALRAEGAFVDGIYSCPHTPDDHCSCRKPETGLLEQAARDFEVDLKGCFVIGDKASDIEAGRRVGATTLLVRTGYGSEHEAQGGALADYVVDDLDKAAYVIEKLLPSARVLGEGKLSRRKEKYP